MANYIVSYDLNGNTPTHAQMDKHMESAGWARGRILETVWYVGSTMNREAVFNHINSILSTDDRLIVVEAREATFRNLLVTDKSFQDEWAKNA